MSTEVAIVAEANMSWSVLSQKSCHKMVVSTSFWSWLLNVSWVFTSLKFTATLFWFIMTCRFVDDSWEHFVLDFHCTFLKYDCLCSSLMLFFVVQVFFIFQESVWLVESSWFVHCCSIHQVYWDSDRCRSELPLWCFLSEKNGHTAGC